MGCPRGGKPTMFIQSAELTPRPGKSGVLGPKVPELRDVLSAETGKDWWAWAAVTGRPFGTCYVSTRVDDFADLIGSQMKIGASSAFADLSSGMDGVLDRPADTFFVDVVAITGEPTPPKQFTTVTRAKASNADLAKAMAWSVEVMEHVTSVTGNGGTVGSSAAGEFFEVFWFSGVDTVEELDAGNQAINDDAGYAGMVAQAMADGLFIAGSVQRSLLAKMP